MKYYGKNGYFIIKLKKLEDQKKKVILLSCVINVSIGIYFDLFMKNEVGFVK